MKYRLLHGYKYELMEDYWAKIEGIVGASNAFVTITPPYFDEVQGDYRGNTSTMFIKTGYAWDGSTCSFDKHSIRASLVHDALYQLMREGLLDKKYRKQADQLYRDMLIEDGLWKSHAWVRYWALRNFAGGGIKPEKKPRGKIIEIGE